MNLLGKGFLLRKQIKLKMNLSDISLGEYYYTLCINSKGNGGINVKY